MQDFKFRRFSRLNTVPHRVKGVSFLRNCGAASVGENNRVIQCYQLSWKQDWMKRLIDTVVIKSADLEDKIFVLEFCDFPNCLDVGKGCKLPYAV